MNALELARRARAFSWMGVALLATAGSAAAFAPGTAPGTAPVAAVQTAQDDERLAAELERLLGAVRNGSPVVKPQAARQLAALGKPAADAVLAWVESDPRGMAALPPELVEHLGRFGDERLRDLLWRALGDADFPWRPAASRSVGLDPRPAELERFVGLSEDVLGTVRAASAESLGRLLLGNAELESDRSQRARSALRGGLRDIDDGARRAAANALCELGELDALYWLAEELRRDDRYWESNSGKAARYAASALVKRHLGDLFGFESRLAPSAEPNVAALERIEAAIAERAGVEKPELPPWVRAGATAAEGILGLELLSCRKGELHLTWTADDRLMVGRGRPFEIALPEGSSAKLLAVVKQHLGTVTEGEIHGVPGCDSERYRFAVEGAPRPAQVHVLKGPEPVPGLRPTPLNAVARELLATLPPGGDDPRVRDLRRRALETLLAIGGELDPPSYPAEH